ncbi:hypothetical protein [Kineococcus rhizosphaerae]|nr:hypothetical protein [Kineococcus rhizosphaerae]
MAFPYVVVVVCATGLIVVAALVAQFLHRRRRDRVDLGRPRRKTR